MKIDVARFVLVVLLCLVGPSSVSAQQIFVESPSQVSVNESFIVNVSVQGVNLTGAEFWLGFDENILGAVVVQEGSFLNGSGATLTLPSNLSDSIDNGTGFVWLGSALTGSSVASGGGLLAAITFRALSVGNSSLDLQNVTLVDEGIELITGLSIVGSSVEVISCSYGGIGICSSSFCCGADDGVCPTDFDGVSCNVSDPDCASNCSYGGVAVCDSSFCCGADDGVCPSDFEGVSCGVSDPDCSCYFGGVGVCGVNFCCGVGDGVCPSDFQGVSCSTSDVDCS